MRMDMKTVTIIPALATMIQRQLGSGTASRRFLTFTVNDQGGTKVECQCICGINDEEERSKAASMPRSGLQLNLVSLSDEAVVHVGEDALSAECLSSANGRDDLLGNGTAFSDESERHAGVEVSFLISVYDSKRLTWCTFQQTCSLRRP